MVELGELSGGGGPLRGGGGRRLSILGVWWSILGGGPSFPGGGCPFAAAGRRFPAAGGGTRRPVVDPGGRAVDLRRRSSGFCAAAVALSSSPEDHCLDYSRFQVLQGPPLDSPPVAASLKASVAQQHSLASPLLSTSTSTAPRLHGSALAAAADSVSFHGSATCSAAAICCALRPSPRHAAARPAAVRRRSWSFAVSVASSCGDPTPLLSAGAWCFWIFQALFGKKGSRSSDQRKVSSATSAADKRPSILTVTRPLCDRLEVVIGTRRRSSIKHFQIDIQRSFGSGRFAQVPAPHTTQLKNSSLPVIKWLKEIV